MNGVRCAGCPRIIGRLEARFKMDGKPWCQECFPKYRKKLRR